ncbi:asparagine synthase-related protein [Mangrovitalea sediminis]|uniref:asparagine synthase-related protein n=1 Tax=Mangrovitalea sediminis TaxID=1982043 RepID=UPI000BE53B76|nr:asparagine synthase-related protein [Mangrovitalea sediminis]
MKPTSFSIALGPTRLSLHDVSCVFEDSHCSLWVNVDNPYYIQYQTDHTGFSLFMGERTASPFEEPEATHPGASGTLIRYDSTTHQFRLSTDRLGTAIVFHRQLGDGTYCLSNRLEHLISNETTVEWHSIQQYLCRGYTLDSKTFFQEIQQTLPNQEITVSLDGPVPSVSVSGRTRSSDDDSEDPVNTIAERLRDHLRSSPPGVLMMSAGWDSRTLLLDGSTPFATAYSHGDLSSRELRITQRLTGSVRLDHIFTEISRLDFTPQLLESMLNENGFCVFPIWYLAAQKIKKIYDAPLVSGVLGELLGGHYGLLSLGNRWQKLKSALFIFNKQRIPDHRIEAAVRKFALPPTSHWFLTDDANAHFSTLADKTAQQTYDSLSRQYQETRDWQLAIEQFNMDHRARQYILKQAQAASCLIGYRLPFADDRAVEAIGKLPFSERVHNKTNQEILRRHHSELLKEPMSATLVGAKYPIPIQELSRGVRIVKELLSRRLRNKSPQLGWFNYEHLYQSSSLYDIIDSLQHEMWDKEKMRLTIKDNPKNSIDAGSTLDMLAKVKTVDYYLAFAKRER